MAEDKRRYLILSSDGSRANLFLTDREGLEAHLEQASRFVEEGGYDVEFISELPVEGSVMPGAWRENEELILEVKVVVPQPVTVKWQIP